MVRLGVHVAKVSHVLPNPYKNRKTMLEAIQIDTERLQLDCCQIFVSGPRSTKMNHMDYNAIKEYCNSKKINLYVHSNYISVGIFNVNKENKDTPKSKNLIKTIINQMDECDKLGSCGFVIHLSKKTPEETVKTLKLLYPLIKKFNTPLLLESPAKKPDDDLTYETPEKINNLTKLIIKNIPKLNWGWVFDTAHLYSAGIEMDSFNVVKKWLGDLKYVKYVKLFHLNGMSLDQFNTGKDVHQVIFSDADDIWNADCHIDDHRWAEPNKVLTDSRSKINDFKNVNDFPKGNNSSSNKVAFSESSKKTIKKSSIWIIIQFAKKNNVDCVCEINRGNYKQIRFSIETLHKLF